MRKFQNFGKTPNDARSPSFVSDGTLFQYSIIFAGVAILAALVVPFVIYDDISYLADNQYGVDTLVTGSIEDETKRYTIRRSILDIN